MTTKNDLPTENSTEDYTEDVSLNNKTTLLFEYGGYAAVSKFKSVKRAIRRGHIDPTGVIYPKRPYNNRKNKPRERVKRYIYGQLKKSTNTVV